ncbi:MAG: polysaccharide deacetylase family protein [Gammaproteobacteria bacterium]
MTRSLFAAALLCLAGAVHPALADDAHAVALVYHRFGESKYPSTDITLERFDAQLDYLANNGYTVWPLARIVRYLKDDKPMPDKTIAITIDDAFESVYTQAYPRLKARGWPFTVFVSTDAVDRHFDAFMTWDQMRKMQAHGVTFANHTASHDHLLFRKGEEDETAWRQRVTADIDKAQRRLKAELGRAPMLFAYPYGEYNTALADLVAELGYTAFGQQSGAMGHYTDPRALPRYPVAGPYGAMPQFKTKVASLPLPVMDYEPWDPELDEDRRPRLVVTLGDAGGARLDELKCYVSHQGETKVQWLDKYTQFAIQAPHKLPEGRSRYNCTAPNRDRTRYYWFSQQWIALPDQDLD